MASLRPWMTEVLAWARTLAWGEAPKQYIVGQVQRRWWPLPAARVS